MGVAGARASNDRRRRIQATGLKRSPHTPTAVYRRTANTHDNEHGGVPGVLGAGYHTIHHTTYKHNYGACA
jgi:hypothetical protein